MATGTGSDTTFLIIDCLVSCIADDNGNVTRAIFDRVLHNVIETIIIASKTDDYVVQKLKEFSASMGVTWTPDAQVEKEFKRTFLAKTKKSFPIVGEAIFRFFDQDGNGTISREEIMFCVKLFVKFTDPAYAEIPLEDRLMDIADAFFRVFDANGNGAIETSEVNTIVKDVIVGIFNLIASLFDHFKSYILGEQLRQVVEVYCNRLRETLRREPFPLHDVVRFNLSIVPQGDRLPSVADRMKQQQSFVDKFFSFEAQEEVGRVKYREFFMKFKERAHLDKLSKAECIEIATSCASDLLDAYMDLNKAEPAVLSYIGDMNLWFSKRLPGAPPQAVDPNQIVNLFKTSIGAMRSHLLSGGLRSYLSHLFDMLDINNDGFMSGAELEELGKSLNGTFEHGMQAGYEQRLAHNQVTLYRFMDANSDNFLTRDEVHKFAAKAGELLFSWINLMVETAREVALAALTPGTAALFGIKAATVGGSKGYLAMTDIQSLSNKIRQDRVAAQLQWSKKEFVLEQVRTDGSLLQKASSDVRGDREVVGAAVENDPSALQYASDELKGDRYIVLSAVRKNGRLLQYASPGLRADWPVVLEALEQDGNAFEYVGDYLKQDKAAARAALSSTSPAPLSSMPDNIKADKELVLAAVRTSGSSLEHAAWSLRADRDVVLTAVQQDGSALQFAAENLRGERDIVLTAIQTYPRALQWASERIRAERDVVLAAVTKDGSALSMAAERHTRDRDIARAALGSQSVCYNCLADELKRDREMATFGVAQAAMNFNYLPDEFKNDRAFVLEAIRNGFNFLSSLPAKFRSDRDVVLAIVSLPSNGSDMNYASDDLKNDPNFVLDAVRGNAYTFNYVSDRLRGDRDLVLKAVQIRGEVLKYVPESLQADKNVVTTAVRQDWDALSAASEPLRGDEALVLMAMQSSQGQALRHGSTGLRANRGFILKAVSVYGDALEYASDELRADRDVVLAAVRAGGNALGYASEDLRKDVTICQTAVDVNPLAMKYVAKELGGQGEVGEDHVPACTIC